MIEALYIHLPFCLRKCHYCDFISYTCFDETVQARYIEALKKEALLVNNDFRNNIQLKSVYFGGGTPTCLSSGLLLDLLSFLRRQFPFQDSVEITIEANPNTLDAENIQMLLGAGFNRVSLGVQSFRQELLQVIGRYQKTEDVYHSVELLRKAGLQNLSLDLMYALPQQSLSDWQDTLQKAIEQAPEHISAYQLQFEEMTPLGKSLEEGKIKEADNDLAFEMYRLTREILENNGYQQYEISNYAKLGWQSVHNKTYWQGEAYLALGAGAHSFLPPYRWENYGNVPDYLINLEANRLPPRVGEKLGEKTLMSEYILMGLRILEGIELAKFTAVFKRNLEDVFAEALGKCLAWGLVEIDQKRLRLTEKGLYLANNVFLEFLLD